MSTWLSETEFRQSGAETAGVTINVAFLQEIKQDSGFRDLLNSLYYRLRPPYSDSSHHGVIPTRPTPHTFAKYMNELRDSLETYFALEEFYGYFDQAQVENQSITRSASKLQQDHEVLFHQLSELVELSEQMAYKEIEVDFDDLLDRFELFCADFAAHEQTEMELMLRLCNEEFGVGD